MHKFLINFPKKFVLTIDIFVYIVYIIFVETISFRSQYTTKFSKGVADYV